MNLEVIDVFKTRRDKANLGYVANDYCCVIYGNPKNSKIEHDLWFGWAINYKAFIWPCKVIYENGCFLYDWNGEKGYPIDEDEQIKIGSQKNNFPKLL